MQDILYARTQMGISLVFHIVFAAIGMAMPLLMVAAELAWQRSGDRHYYELARAWGRGTAVLFAVGAVSGTVLSFELGLLFPTFMRYAGPVIGMPFSLEGFAFFTEAIFLGIYLYGWERVPPRAHLAAGALVAFAGMLSAVFVTIANAWMNAPRGFRVEGGKFVDIDPIEAMHTPFALHEVVHMVLAAYVATALGAASIHAWALLRHPGAPLHRHALRIAMGVAIPSAILQPFVGHFAGHQVALFQPLKLAAMEGQLVTEAWAPLRIGPIAIPGGLSILAYNDPHAVVRGLEEFPRDDWPNPIVHPSFQLMVAIGTLLAAHAVWGAWLWLRGRMAANRPFLLATTAAGPLAFLAIEAGWVVTEIGRQPWVIYGVMRTNASVTPMPGLIGPLVTFTLVYIALGMTVVTVLRHHVRATAPPRTEAR